LIPLGREHPTTAPSLFEGWEALPELPLVLAPAVPVVFLSALAAPAQVAQQREMVEPQWVALSVVLPAQAVLRRGPAAASVVQPASQL